MKTAKEIKKLAGKGDARLYKLSEPVACYLLRGEETKLTDYVIVSAVVTPYSGEETFIFPATSEGKPINHLELEGSLRDTLSHAAALRFAGFTLIES